MANLKEIKIRITSVHKTRQITSAMKLVAAAKLKGATDRALAAQPYQQKLRSVLARVAASGSASNALLRKPEQVRKVLLVMFTSDRGLCGGFNNILLRRAFTWMAERKAEGVDVTVRVFGRKGRDFYQVRGIKPSDSVIEYAKTPKMDLVRPLSDHMVGGFIDGHYDEVWTGHNVFKSAATQLPTFTRVLPLTIEDQAAEPGGAEYQFEPQGPELLDNLLPQYLRTLLLQALLDTEAGEFAARMMAMDNATRNAGELVKTLTLQYNRARQAAITTEITEIVSGAEAL